MNKFNILKVLFVFVLLFTPIGCCNTPKESISNNNIENIDTNITDTTVITYGASYMKNSYERIFTPKQFDSICTADYLDKDLTKWHQFSSKDGETGVVFSEWMFIKYNKNEEIIYRVMKTKKGNYKITKRIRIR